MKKIILVMICEAKTYVNTEIFKFREFEVSFKIFFTSQLLSDEDKLNTKRRGI